MKTTGSSLQISSSVVFSTFDLFGFSLFPLIKGTINPKHKHLKLKHHVSNLRLSTRKPRKEPKAKLADFFSDFIVDNGVLYGVKDNATILVGIIKYN
jgi:hypothetical protein